VLGPRRCPPNTTTLHYWWPQKRSDALRCQKRIQRVRARSKPGGGLANSGLQAFALFFKLIALLVVLFAALAADRNLALTTALTYGLAYTFELGFSLASYFGTQSA